MSSSARELRRLVTTKSRMKPVEPKETVAGLSKVMTAIASSQAGNGTATATTSASKSNNFSSSASSSLGGAGGANNPLVAAFSNVTLSTAVIPGAPDPVKMLALTQEDVRNTTELHMGRKGVRLIHPNFQHFVNLEILWLNQNELTAVQGLIPAMGAREALARQAIGSATGQKKASSLPSNNGQSSALSPGFAAALQQKPMSSTLLLLQHTAGAMIGTNKSKRGGVDEGSQSDDERNDKERTALNNGGALNKALAVPPRGCRRLKHLYLSDNRITTVDGDIQQLKYLETLLLANNLLTDMHAVSRSLRHLQFLKKLDLFGNPLCEQLGYRLYIIAHHPSVEVLDRERVTDEERAQARQAFASSRTGHLSSNSFAAAAGGGPSSPSFNLSSLAEKGSSVGSSSVMNGGGGGNGLAKDASADSPTASSASGRHHLLTAKERVAQPTPVAFGAAVPKAVPMRRAEAISQSVALLEARAAMIVAEHAATRRRAEDKEAAELAELAEQRRLFHTAWESAAALQEARQQEQAAKAAEAAAMLQLETTSGGLGSTAGGGGRRLKGASSLGATVGGGGGVNNPSPTSTAGGGKNNNNGGGGTNQQQPQQLLAQQQQQQAMADYNRMLAEATHQQSLARRDRLVSRLFGLDTEKALDHNITEIIELQRRKEEAENIGDAEQAEALAAEIAAVQHRLLPERGEDGFRGAMAAADEGSAAEDGRRYNTHIVENVMLFPSELAAVKRQFQERGSVFTLDRLRHLLIACTASAPSPSPQAGGIGVGGGPFSPSDMAATSSQVLRQQNPKQQQQQQQQQSSLTVPLPEPVIDAIRRAFIERYPAPAEVADLHKLPTIRSSNARALSVVAGAALPSSGGGGAAVGGSSTESNNASSGGGGKAGGKKQLSSTGSGTPQSSALGLGGGAGAKGKAGQPPPPSSATTSPGSAPLSPPNASSPSRRPSSSASFSVDAALFMAARDRTNAEAALAAPIAVYDALVALSRTPPFVAAKLRLVEDLAAAAMRGHQYGQLKAFQQRINDLTAHLAALRQQKEKGKGDKGGKSSANMSLKPSLLSMPRHSNASSTATKGSGGASQFDVAAFAAASASASGGGSGSGASSDAAAATFTASVDPFIAPYLSEGYVELTNVKSLWGSVQTRLSERAAEASNAANAAAAAAAAAVAATAASTSPSAGGTDGANSHSQTQPPGANKKKKIGGK